MALPPLGFAGSAAARLAATTRPPPLDPLAAADPLVQGDAPCFHRLEVEEGEPDPLGLVMDWSMPLPVVSSIMPDSLAAARGTVASGDVMVGINSHGLCCGVKRPEVDFLLQQRPLSIAFERPDPLRVGQMGLAPWQRAWKRETAHYVPPEPDHAVDEWDTPASEPASESEVSVPPLKLAHLIPSLPRTPVKTFGQRWLEPRAENMDGDSLRKAFDSEASPGHLSGVMSPSMSSDAPVSPSKSVMLRKPMPRVLSECLLRGQDLTDLRTWHLDDSRSISLPKLTPALPSDASPPKRSALRKGFSAQVVAKRSYTSLKCLARGQSMPAPTSPDQCYAQINADPQNLGPGPSERWPLNHGPEAAWLCRMTDLILATRIREAYEFGFRGRKRHYVPVLQLAVEPDAAERLFRRPGRVDEVKCDVCGVLILDKENSGAFYYCRQCKKHGIRYELCIGCHAVEVLQGEGKFQVKDELHPHWQHCSHHSLQFHPSLAEAYPHATHLKRACCDYCGHPITIVGLQENPIYVCSFCPEQRGYRFELCEPCAVALRERGYQAVRTASRSASKETVTDGAT